MQFLYPIAFFAAFALILPILIHLWNVKKGKTIKIGSISLLGERAQQSSKSYRITDWLLLLLRCFILLLLVATLAEPFLSARNSTSTQKGWILVRSAEFPQVFKSNSKEIKALISKGYELHDFDLSFKRLSIKDSLKVSDTSKTLLPATALLTALNERVRPGADVFLFADKKLVNFGEELPEIHFRLHWQALTQVDSLSWVKEYAGKKYKGTSTPSGTRYTPIQNQQKPELSVLIHQQAGINDAKYLTAAIQAIATYSNRHIKISYWPAVARQDSFDMGFWLSESRPDRAFVEGIKNDGSILQYESGKVSAIRSFIQSDGRGSQHIALYKRVNTNKNPGKALWTDGFGDPLLSTERINKQQRYHFYSRFNPQWNELVWNESFVQVLMPILITNHAPETFGFESNPNDQRKFPLNQKETIAASKPRIFHPVRDKSPVELPFWIAAFTLFLLERTLSFRKKRAYVKN